MNQNNNNKNNKKKHEQYDPVKSKQVSIAFVGSTGAGKTTLLASLRDYIDKKDYNSIQQNIKIET